MQTLILAFNRVYVIVFQKHNLRNPRFCIFQTLVFMTFLYFTGGIFIFIMPRAGYYYSLQTLSWVMEDTQFNRKLALFEIIHNLTCVGLAFVCYVVIFIHLAKHVSLSHNENERMPKFGILF